MSAATDVALLASATLMGLAGAPHCAAMCGATCAAAGGAGRGRWIFHVARIASYAAAGAAAAAGVEGIAAAAAAVAALRPMWTMLHVAAFGLGVFLVWRGRQPAWVEAIGAARVLRPRVAVDPGDPKANWQPLVFRTEAPRRIAIGLAWAAWPCGLLQSALVVAALAGGPAQGAAAMTGFATASAAGLVVGPALWRRIGAPGASPTAVVRLAGVALAATSIWALMHGLWQGAGAWCIR